MSVKLSLTCSTIFLVPQLKIDRSFLLDREIGFVNAYLEDAQAEVTYEDALLVLFKPTNTLKFQQFVEQERERTKLLVDDYDYSEGLTVLVYQLPEGFESDLRKFKKGQYSKFSEKFKENFPENLMVTDPATGRKKEDKGLAWRICNKTDDLREFWERELGFSFDEEDELWQKPLLKTEGKSGATEILDVGRTPIRTI